MFFLKDLLAYLFPPLDHVFRSIHTFPPLSRVHPEEGRSQNMLHCTPSRPDGSIENLIFSEVSHCPGQHCACDGGSVEVHYVDKCAAKTTPRPLDHS